MGVFDLGLGNIFKRPTETVIKRGDCIIIANWNWNKIGYDRRIICVDEKGNISIKPL